MNKARVLKALPLVLVLAACGGGDGGLCSASRAAEASFAPACSPLPPVNPVGSWQGTLTTLSGGSGTQPFAAEIVKSASEVSGGFIGTFTVGDEVYEVTGGNRSINGESKIFTFSIPVEELQSALSPGEFYGMMWSGPMTESTYSGGWFFNSETSYRSPAGEFTLERTR